MSNRLIKNMLLTKETLTFEIVASLLSYDPATGIFTRLSGPKQGTRAGFQHINGYRKITFGHAHTCAVYEHRLAVLLMTGSWPEEGLFVDHLDGVRNNNAYVNLRIVDRATNSWNCKVSKVNLTGRTGVAFDKRNGKWIAFMCVRGVKYRWAGLNDFYEAVKMREMAEMLYRGGVNWRQPIHPSGEYVAG